MRFLPSLYRAIGDKSALYSWITMSSQLLFMVAIVPLASIRLTPADLAFWLSALLLTALSAPADFGVYNTIIRSLPFLKNGKTLPKFMSPGNKQAVDTQTFESTDSRLRMFGLITFGFKQLLIPVITIFIMAVFVGYFIYTGRSSGSINLTFILTLFFYWLVIPIQVFARFIESILIGGGAISVAKRNEAVAVMLRVLAISGLMLQVIPISMFAFAHLITTCLQFTLNFFSAQKTVLHGFDCRCINKYLKMFPKEERAYFTKGQYRFGVNVFSSYLIMNAGPIAVTNMKSDQSVSFYLIMVKMFLAIKQFAQVPVTVAIPNFVLLRAEEKKAELLDLFTQRSLVTVALFVCGLGLSFIYVSYLFDQAKLNYFFYLSMFGLVMFLELNHSNHAQLVLSRNVQPFLVPSFASGILCALLMYPMFLKAGIFGVILVQGVVQLVFSNWYSVYLNISEFGDKSLALYRYGKKGLR